MAKKSSFLPYLRHVLALIPMGIRLRAFLGMKTNPSFLSHKTISEQTLIFPASLQTYSYTPGLFVIAKYSGQESILSTDRINVSVFSLKCHSKSQ